MSDDRTTFEQTKARLEEILEQVRRKDTSLERSLELLEEGVRLANRCNELIDQTGWRPSEQAGDEGETPEGAEGEVPDAAAEGGPSAPGATAAGDDAEGAGDDSGAEREAVAAPDEVPAAEAGEGDDAPAQAPDLDDDERA